MRIWDYAEMSKSAREMGGPGKYADFLVSSGRKDVIPWAISGWIIALGLGGAIGIPKLVKYIKGQKEKKEKVVTMAKEELIKQINEYNEKMS